MWIHFCRDLTFKFYFRCERKMLLHKFKSLKINLFLVQIEKRTRISNEQNKKNNIKMANRDA